MPNVSTVCRWYCLANLICLRLRRLCAVRRELTAMSSTFGVSSSGGGDAWCWKLNRLLRLLAAILGLCVASVGGMMSDAAVGVGAGAVWSGRHARAAAAAAVTQSAVPTQPPGLIFVYHEAGFYALVDSLVNGALEVLSVNISVHAYAVKSTRRARSVCLCCGWDICMGESPDAVAWPGKRNVTKRDALCLVFKYECVRVINFSWRSRSRVVASSCYWSALLELSKACYCLSGFKVDQNSRHSLNDE